MTTLENELVTIIIPVYNVEEFLSKCLDSVISQTYSNLEIILIDDGSTDASSLICDNYSQKDSRIRVFHLQNGGRSFARNFGISKSRGRYISFVDSDDWIANDMIEKLVDNLLTSCVDVVLCQFYKVYPNGEKIKNQGSIYPKLFMSKTELYQQVLSDSIVTNHVWRYLFKREDLPKNVFPEGRNFEDILAIPDMLKNVNVALLIDAPLYYYRVNPKGIVHSKKLIDLKEEYSAFKEAGLKIESLNVGDLTSNLVRYKVIKALGILTDLYKISDGDTIEVKEFKRSLRDDIKNIRFRDVIGLRRKILFFTVKNFPIFDKFICQKIVDKGK